MAAFNSHHGLPNSPVILVLDLGSEFLFFMDIIFNFFVEYKDEETFVEVSEFLPIAKRYAKKSFIIDMIAWLPIQLFYDHPKMRIFRLLKLLRMRRLVQLLDVEKFKTIYGSH